jgi:hypothetical protein
MDKAPMELDFSRGTLCITIIIGLIAVVLIAKSKRGD